MSKQEFNLFVDDSGSQKPSQNDQVPHFAMGGVLVKRQDSDIIVKNLEQFKKQWNIPSNVPLHGNEIRSMKQKFAWLGNLEESNRLRFYKDLSEMIISCPITVHACAISRFGYNQRYLERYGKNTWEMMRTAFSILLERAAKFAARQNGKMMVYYEKMGPNEDKKLESYFHELRSNGHPFSSQNASKYDPLPSEELSLLLTGIQGKNKTRPELQIADLCLYPVARVKDQPNNRAYHAMYEGRLLVDCHLQPEEREKMGIKYSCFDN